MWRSLLLFSPFPPYTRASFCVMQAGLCGKGLLLLGLHWADEQIPCRSPTAENDENTAQD